MMKIVAKKLQNVYESRSITIIKIMDGYEENKL